MSAAAAPEAAPRLKPPRRSQAERSETTRQALIAATIRVIEERGIGNASSFEIAKAARLTPGAIQHHFESKRALILQAATQLVHADDQGGALQVWPAAEGPLPERALAAVRSAWRLVYAQDRYLTMWSIFLASRTDDALLAHLAAERDRLRQRSVERFLNSFPELARAPDGEVVATLVFSTLRGMALNALFEPPVQTQDQQLQLLAELIQQRCTAAPAQPVDPAAQRTGPAGARRRR